MTEENERAAFGVVETAADGPCGFVAAARAAPGAEAPAHAPSRDRVLPFLIKRDGTWLYRGTPVRRKPMVCLFGSMLTRDADGGYWLETPMECGSIQVEDAPFLAVQLEFSGRCGRRQTLCLRTNIDEVVCVGPEHPLMVNWNRPCCEESAPVPYVVVRKGEGEWPILARLTRAVYYELAALAVTAQVNGTSCFGVWSGDHFYPLGRSS
ncbi:DUF1285 domain-containing protein [Acidomonas methanolica]|uniref:DUF1285 domain-containing protein n=1 Tax=Acidomonas methanolica TaxID=437 RepID=UPI000AAABCFE|nr:hypothetical protein EDC31_104119 [Acidomonas methanolica]GBQ52026.1 hypothetical protein AA0498_1640 [Acidomonas methanolica]GEK98279.1 hypothetical protein AME01nite_07780 [Acidomonas methanolica NBRC 104435]